MNQGGYLFLVLFCREKNQKLPPVLLMLSNLLHSLKDSDFPLSGVAFHLSESFVQSIFHAFRCHGGSTIYLVYLNLCVKI